MMPRFLGYPCLNIRKVTCPREKCSMLARQVKLAKKREELFLPLNFVGYKGAECLAYNHVPCPAKLLFSIYADNRGWARDRRVHACYLSWHFQQHPWRTVFHPCENLVCVFLQFRRRNPPSLRNRRISRQAAKCFFSLPWSASVVSIARFPALISSFFSCSFVVMLQYLRQRRCH